MSPFHDPAFKRKFDKLTALDREEVRNFRDYLLLIAQGWPVRCAYEFIYGEL